MPRAKRNAQTAPKASQAKAKAKAQATPGTGATEEQKNGKRAYNKRQLHADSRPIDPNDLARLQRAMELIAATVEDPEGEDAGNGEVGYTPLKLAQHATARLFRQDSKPCVIVTRSDGSAMCAVFTFPKPAANVVEAPESWDTL